MDLDLAEVARIFQAEAAESLAGAEQALTALEAKPGDSEALATVFRAVHTIKGNAASLDYGGVSELAHGLEDTLQRLRDRRCATTPELLAVLLRGLDALSDGIEAATTGHPEIHPEQVELLQELRLRTDGVAPTASPAAGTAPGRAGQTRSAREATLRVDQSQLDRMLDLTSELAIAHGHLRLTLGTGAHVRGAQDEVDRLLTDLQELVMKVRLVPLGPVFRRAARTVRDLAAAHGRSARLRIEGEDVEVDTSVIEHIRDPLTHMIRNAVDHGIEAPDVRRSRGKDPCGTLVLRARREAGSIVVELEDDGAGLDHARILARARTKGWLAPDAEPSEAELRRLVFEPGFSTADGVTRLSGRGVGLDVVRRNVEALRGSATISSRSGSGTVVTLRLPLTLAIIPGLIVEAGRETFVVPLDFVVECLDLAMAGPSGEDEACTLDLRGQCVPCLRLSVVFGAGRNRARAQVVVVRQPGNLVGLVVDRVVGETQAVIKPLGPLFHALRWFSAGTILDNGRVAAILDVPALVQAVTAEAAGAAGARASLRAVPSLDRRRADREPGTAPLVHEEAPC